MFISWKSIEFESINSQCALSSNCISTDLIQLEAEFKAILQDLANIIPSDPFNQIRVLKKLIEWLEDVVDRLIDAAGIAGSGSMRSVIVKFAFFTSQIMRDLVNKPSEYTAFRVAPESN